jgi:hypothetical protein
MLNKEENRFFTKEAYETEIGLDINEDVLKRIYSDNIQPTDKLPVEFFYLTDTEVKAFFLKSHLLNNFTTYTDIKVQEYEGNYEVSGITEPIEMSISTINHWNQQMWDLGYAFDCKLDGWQVGVKKDHP